MQIILFHFTALCVMGLTTGMCGNARSKWNPSLGRGVNWFWLQNLQHFHSFFPKMSPWKTPLRFCSKGKQAPAFDCTSLKKNNNNKKVIYIFESWIILAKRGEQHLNRIHGHWKGFRGFGGVCWQGSISLLTPFRCNEPSFLLQHKTHWGGWQARFCWDLGCFSLVLIKK